jgi:hypothetical protein
MSFGSVKIPIANNSKKMKPITHWTKSNNTFKVTFKSVVGILDDSSKALTAYLTQVSDLSDNGFGLSAFGLTDPCTVVFTFTDDVDDQVYDGLQVLKNAPKDQIEIDITYYKDATKKEVIRTLRLVQPTISTIKLSKLDYSSSDGLTIKMTVIHNGFIKL